MRWVLVYQDGSVIMFIETSGKVHTNSIVKEFDTEQEGLDFIESEGLEYTPEDREESQN